MTGIYLTEEGVKNLQDKIEELEFDITSDPHDISNKIMRYHAKILKGILSDAIVIQEPKKPEGI